MIITKIYSKYVKESLHYDGGGCKECCFVVSGGRVGIAGLQPQRQPSGRVSQTLRTSYLSHMTAATT